METSLHQQPSKQYSRHHGYAVFDSKPANISSANGYIYVELLALFVFVPQGFMLGRLARYCLLAYIRTKRVKGILYAYLVQSKWDKRRSLSIQHNIKYLGRSDDVEINDIL